MGTFFVVIGILSMVLWTGGGAFVGYKLATTPLLSMDQSVIRFFLGVDLSPILSAAIVGGVFFLLSFAVSMSLISNGIVLNHQKNEALLQRRIRHDVKEIRDAMVDEQYEE